MQDQEQAAAPVAFEATGVGGELFVGHQSAGRFGAWRLVAPNRNRWTVTAEEYTLHDYFARHGPDQLRIRLSLGASGAWTGTARIVGEHPLRLTGQGVMQPE